MGLLCKRGAAGRQKALLCLCNSYNHHSPVVLEERCSQKLPSDCMESNSGCENSQGSSSFKSPFSLSLGDLEPITHSQPNLTHSDDRRIKQNRGKLCMPLWKKGVIKCKDFLTSLLIQFTSLIHHMRPL